MDSYQIEVRHDVLGTGVLTLDAQGRARVDGHALPVERTIIDSTEMLALPAFVALSVFNQGRLVLQIQPDGTLAEALFLGRQGVHRTLLVQKT